MAKILKRKDYDKMCQSIREILDIQKGENPPGELILPDSLFFGKEVWETHDPAKYIDLYLPLMLVYVIKDEDGEYIFQPVKSDGSKCNNDMVKETRAYIEKFLDNNLQIED